MLFLPALESRNSSLPHRHLLTNLKYILKRALHRILLQISRYAPVQPCPASYYESVPVAAKKHASKLVFHVLLFLKINGCSPKKLLQDPPHSVSPATQQNSSSSISHSSTSVENLDLPSQMPDPTWPPWIHLNLVFLFRKSPLFHLCVNECSDIHLTDMQKPHHANSPDHPGITLVDLGTYLAFHLLPGAQEAVALLDKCKATEASLSDTMHCQPDTSPTPSTTDWACQSTHDDYLHCWAIENFCRKCINMRLSIFMSLIYLYINIERITD